MAKQELYILTGGPCTGKTSIGRQLAHNGYLVLPESARTVIQEQATKENPILPQTDPVGFQLEVLYKQEQLEDFVRELGDLPHGGPVFLDRSKIDNLAYCRVFDIQPPIELMRACLQAADSGLYSRVYLMDRIPYQTDAERTESPELAEKIHYAITNVYTELGYELIHVKDMGGPEPRAAFIESTLEKKVYALGGNEEQNQSTGEEKIYSLGAPCPPPEKWGSTPGGLLYWATRPKEEREEMEKTFSSLDEFATKILRGE